MTNVECNNYVAPIVDLSSIPFGTFFKGTICNKASIPELEGVFLQCKNFCVTIYLDPEHPYGSAGTSASNHVDDGLKVANYQPLTNLILTLKYD